MRYQRFLRNTVAGIVLCALSAVAHAGQNQPAYKFTAAAREIAQLYWLAETANACGWATRQEVDRIEAFAVRFLAAHLSGTYRAAFYSLTGEAGFQPGVRCVAFDDRSRNCDQARWKNGWTSYKSVADENAVRY